jgi:hypothetical protein
MKDTKIKTSLVFLFGKNKDFQSTKGKASITCNTRKMRRLKNHIFIAIFLAIEKFIPANKRNSKEDGKISDFPLCWEK